MRRLWCLNCGKYTDHTDPGYSLIRCTDCGTESSTTSKPEERPAYTVDQLIGDLVNELTDHASALHAYWMGHSFDEQADVLLGRVGSTYTILSHITRLLAVERRTEAERLAKGRKTT